MNIDEHNIDIYIYYGAQIKIDCEDFVISMVTLHILKIAMFIHSERKVITKVKDPRTSFDYTL